MHLCGIFDLAWMVRHGRLLHRARGLTRFLGAELRMVPGVPGPKAVATVWGCGIGVAFSAGLQPAVCAQATWGCAPGYDSAGLQPAVCAQAT
jgi:hypothetical protein